VYAVGVLGVLHFFLRVKADATEPMTYAVVLAALFGVRLVDGARTRRKKLRRAAAL
jgi:sulfoxide reductase heme-binding subunit YedZ